MSLRGKPSLPHLKTNLPLLQHSSNALSKELPDAPVIPNGAVRTTSLFREDRHDENLVPILLPECRPMLVTPRDNKDTPVAKSKKMYYEDVFTVRGSHNSPKDRVAFESVVVVELKVNTWVKDDVSATLADLSHVLAEMYQRPETSMLVTIDQNANILFCGTMGPAYLLKVSALSCLIGPLSNVRHTTLIQEFMRDTFGIAPEKGVVMFIPMSEENLATGGITAKDGIDLLGRGERSPSIFKSISRSMSRRLKSSSDQSAPLSLASIISPDITTPSTRSPAARLSGVISPLDLYRPADFNLTESINPSSSGEGPAIGNASNSSPLKNEKVDTEHGKKEHLKDMVRRAIRRDEKKHKDEKGQALKHSKSPPKGKKD